MTWFKRMAGRRRSPTAVACAPAGSVSQKTRRYLKLSAIFFFDVSYEESIA
jgi:hypothetical protein